MSVCKESQKKIVTRFNEAIDSYNSVVKLRENTEKYSIVEEFNSNVQYYSAIETAFRCVIVETIQKECPYNLHEMIKLLMSDLPSNPLAKGIDLFYILRYKDTRNQMVHMIDLCKMNAYPKLFMHAYNFIKEYITHDITVNNWYEECEEFDYSSFNQVFKQSVFDNVRVLVLPPIYSLKEKIDILFSYHWNIVLDFDPYSEQYGSFSRTSISNKKLIQLCQIEKYSGSDFSVDDVTWMMCDGDALMNVDSFQPKNKQNSPYFIPSLLEGASNWTTWYNLSESTKDARKLITIFFEKYFEKMQYSVDLFFAMDYSSQVHSAIYNSLSLSINNLLYDINVHVLNESLSRRLNDDLENYERWYPYNATLHSFIDKISTNSVEASRQNDVYLLPCKFPSDGKLSSTAYTHISKEFFVLHSSFPVEGDEVGYDKTNPVRFDAERFLRGEQATWRLIKSNLIPSLDIKNSLLKKLEKAIESGRSYYDFYHAAGYGGSTIAKQVAYELSKRYPVLFMKKYAKDELGNRITSIYNITRTKIVIWIEEVVFNNYTFQRNECLKIAESTSAQVLLVFVGRRVHKFSLRLLREGMMLCKYGLEDTRRIIEMNKNMIDANEDQMKIIDAPAEDYYKALGEENICPFLINLSIYKGEFIKIDDYIKPFIGEIVGRQDTLKVFVYTCIFTAFINKGLPRSFICQKLKLAENSGWEKLADKYDPLIYVRPNLEYSISEVVIRAPYMAECILKRLLGKGKEGLLYRNELNKYLKDLISDIKDSYENSSYATNCLKQLFIDKSHSGESDDEYTSSVSDKDVYILRKYFAPIIEKLWDKDKIVLAGDIFEKLIDTYPYDSYYYAHAARYYSYTGRDYSKGHEYIKRAIELIEHREGNYSVKADIYHVKGMCIREELFKKINSLPQDAALIQKSNIEELLRMYNESSCAFETTLRNASYIDTKTTEFAYTAWLTLILKVVVRINIKLLSKKEQVKEIMTGLSLIDNLEDLYLQSEDKNNDELISKMEDVSRKKESLYACQKEFAEAIGDWNNYYDIKKQSGEYESCFYSCKQKFFLIEKQTKGFSSIDDKNMKRIKKLAEDCYESLLHMNYSSLRIGDIKTMMEISKVANYQLDNPLSLISEMYQQEKTDLQLLYYRYVLTFLRAYRSDKLALKETLTYLRECKAAAVRYPGKANILDYYTENTQMGQLISRRRLVAKDEQYRVLAYKSDELSFAYGIIKQQGTETTILPFDFNGEIMTGIEVHANLVHNPDVESGYGGQKVRFRFGFSYDGLKAENMSIRYVTDKLETQENVFLEKGGYADFVFIRTTAYKDTSRIYGILGYVGGNEHCLIHIKNISKDRIFDEEMALLAEYCSHNTIRVQLIEKSNRGWEGSLKSQPIDFAYINL